MPVRELHAQVISVALAAAAVHGFALGGGNALLAHGVISRPTQDVDLFTDQEHGVEAAAGAVEAALRDVGFEVEREQDAAGLADIFPGMGDGLAEWIITAPGGPQLTMQLAYFDRGRDPWPWRSARSWTWKTWPAARSARWQAGSSPATTPTPPGCSNATARPS